MPTIRIDFGDGHVATRTLHGNIASYVCAANRQVVDILPGIYTPLGYVAALGALRDLPGTLGQDWQRQLPAYHRERAHFLRSQPARIVYARGAVAPPPTTAPTSAADVRRPAAPQTNTSPIAAGSSQTGGFAGGSFQGGGIQGGGFQGGGVGGGGGFKGGIERRTEQIVRQAPGNAGNISAPGPRPRPGSDLADWQPLALDTWHNETQRRLLIHDRLAQPTSVRPVQIKRWLYKEVLHADLDDPYLGLGDALFGDDVFGEDQ